MPPPPFRSTPALHPASVACPPTVPLPHTAPALLIPVPFALPNWWAPALIIALQGALIVALVIAIRRWVAARRALEERLRFERVLSELSADLGQAPAAKVDSEIAFWLTGLLRPFDLDGAEITLFAEVDCSDDLPFCAAEILHGRMVAVTRLESLPAEARADRRALDAAGVRSLVLVPLAGGGQTLGFLALFVAAREREWSVEFLRGMGIVGEVFAGALMRRQARAALGSSDALDRATIMQVDAASRASAPAAAGGWLDIGALQRRPREGDKVTLRAPVQFERPPPSAPPALGSVRLASGSGLTLRLTH